MEYPNGVSLDSNPINGIFWSITCPKKEGKICIIFCKYLFSLKSSTDGEPNVFEDHSEIPKIQEANPFFLAKYISKKVKKKLKLSYKD